VLLPHFVVMPFGHVQVAVALEPEQVQPVGPETQILVSGSFGMLHDVVPVGHVQVAVSPEPEQLQPVGPSTQVLPHCVVPVGHLQVAVAPEPEQLQPVGAGTQVLPHGAMPVGHMQVAVAPEPEQLQPFGPGTQAPPQQFGVLPEHVVPHPPQLLGELMGRLFGHTQLPLRHVAPVGHTFPHVPQLPASVFKSVHPPSQHD